MGELHRLRSPNAKVVIHKVGLNSTAPAAGDSASFKLQDLGVVATVTADACGIQVFFMEQFPASLPAVNYYLYLKK